MSAILLVDDEKHICESLGTILRIAGHTVQTSSNAQEALELIRRNEFDILVIDIVLPGKSGIDLLRSLRQAGCRVPAIVITGEPGDATAVESEQLGASAYLCKPVSGSEILRVIEAAVISAGAQRI